MSSLDRILPYLQSIAHLLTDPAITDVMVNAGGRHVWVERDGIVSLVQGCTIDELNLKVAIKTIARSCGEDISEDCPILDARLEDGSRVAALFPPASVDGATLTIRLFGKRLTLAQLVELGSLTAAQSDALIYAVWTRQNILISGGAGVGKTTLLNALAAYIPDDQRIVLIEDTTELQIDKPNRPRFEANHAGVTVASLLKASLRHRPSRLIVGEVRGAEAFDLLQALNSGHQGSLSTIHATSAPRALTRLARCAMQASSSLSHDVIWPDILESIQVVVHLDRVGPLRKVTAILDVAEGVAA